MEMTGERRIPASRQAVWDALNDPEALRAAIPGCESVERIEGESFNARVAVKLGPMAAKFAAKLHLENLNPPTSYTISGEGNGGAMGFAKGGAEVQLEELGPAETLLKYQVKAQVGGKMAQLGARLIDSTAKSMADQFFERFAGALTPAPEPAMADAAPNAHAENPPTPSAQAPNPPGAQQPLQVGGDVLPKPVVAPRPLDDYAYRPLSLLTQIEPLGLPLLFWGGLVIWLVILALMFL